MVPAERRCDSCRSVLATTARFCQECGRPAGEPDTVPTHTVEESTAGTPPPGWAFAPGTILGGRYQIVALLGRGGMGVVYRADDLKLGQAVALKFLSSGMAREPERLKSLYAETRSARQISHPNVCRVYDVSEHEGQHFIAMEYVDGEDLASLLRRIGALPAAKALEIAGELCAGLAAAHELGILHCDLKPANVLVDGRGHARIADFGLAGRSDAEGSPPPAAGTLPYMAPELLAGAPPSVRSDLYALGLVLYELYAGRRAFPARSVEELRALQAAGPEPLAKRATGIAPAIEGAIMRCLEGEPKMRPASAKELAAALPGGDPLAAAIAAGHIPSPEMLAASGLEGALRPAAAWSALAVFAVLVFAVAHLSRHATLLGRVRPSRSPQVLADRARAVLERAGYGAGAADSAYWFRAVVPPRPGTPDAAYLRFVYRQSPTPLGVPGGLSLSWSRPPLDEPGMVNVELDSAGVLRRLEGAPSHASSPAAPVEWEVLFEEAGLDVDSLVPDAADWTPARAHDVKRAWRVSRGRDEEPLRVRAAADRARPVLFELEDSESEQGEYARVEGVSGGVRLLWFLVWVAWIVPILYFARRSIRLRRADTRGAFRVAAVLALWWFAADVLGAHHAYASAGELHFAIRSRVASTVWVALLAWLAYVAFEPFARRYWPGLLVSWSRVLAGRWRDPGIGRDLLLGSVAGAGFAAATLGLALAATRLIGAGTFVGSDLGPLLGLRYWSASVLGTLGDGLATIVVAASVLAVGRAVLRSRPAAVCVMALLVALVELRAVEPWLPLTIAAMQVAATVAILLVVMLRLGFVAGFVAYVVGTLLLRVPPPVDMSPFYAGGQLLTLLVVLAVATSGFVASFGGRPLLGEEAPG